MGRTPRIFVLSGPSGCGKGTILKSVLERRPQLGLTVSATTRSPREGEIDGIAYHFVSEERFSQLVDEGAFFEWANVHGHRYGTLWSEIDRIIAQGSSVMLEIDVQGGFAAREKRPDVVLIFVEPPSMEELERRLRARGTEDEKTIQLRLANAHTEMAQADRYDARLVNDDLEEAIGEMISLIDRYENDGGSEQDVSHQARDRQLAGEDRAQPLPAVLPSLQARMRHQQHDPWPAPASGGRPGV